MDLLSIFGVALALAMDALAVSVAVGLRLAHVTVRHTFRISFHFGFFQFLMPILGWLGGAQFASAIAGWDHWLVFALLGALGGKMIWQALTGKMDTWTNDPTRGWSLVSLSLATSLDALAIGVFRRINMAGRRDHRPRCGDTQHDWDSGGESTGTPLFPMGGGRGRMRPSPGGVSDPPDPSDRSLTYPDRHSLAATRFTTNRSVGPNG